MLKVSTAEFQRNIEKYQDMVHAETVSVTNGGQDVAVLISAEAYRHLIRANRRVMGPGDFTDEELEEILNAEIPMEAAAFNHEIEN